LQSLFSDSGIEQFVCHNQFTVKLKLVVADGLVASELLSVNAFTVTV